MENRMLKCEKRNKSCDTETVINNFQRKNLYFKLLWLHYGICTSVNGTKEIIEYFDSNI